MELKVISPTKTKIYTVAWLEVFTWHGNFIIQPGHSPIVLMLSPNKPILFRLKNGKQESIFIAKGILEVNRHIATVLMNEAE